MEWLRADALLPLAVLTVLSACATLPEPTAQEGRLVYRDFASAFAGTDPLAAHRYRAVMIDPFVVATERSSPGVADSTTELQRALVTTIEAHRLVTTQQGPDVLRLEVVVKDIDTSSPTLNVITTLLAFVPFDTGGITADIHLRDAQSGALLATVHADEKVTPLHISGSFSRYGHAKSIVRRWGREVAGLL